MHNTKHKNRALMKKQKIGDGSIMAVKFQSNQKTRKQFCHRTFKRRVQSHRYGLEPKRTTNQTRFFSSNGTQTKTAEKSFRIPNRAKQTLNQQIDEIIQPLLSSEKKHNTRYCMNKGK